MATNERKSEMEKAQSEKTATPNGTFAAETRNRQAKYEQHRNALQWIATFCFGVVLFIFHFDAFFASRLRRICNRIMDFIHVSNVQRTFYTHIPDSHIEHLYM